MYSGKVWQVFGNLAFFDCLVKKVWRISRLSKRLLIVNTNLVWWIQTILQICLTSRAKLFHYMVCLHVEEYAAYLNYVLNWNSFYKTRAWLSLHMFTLITETLACYWCISPKHLLPCVMNGYYTVVSLFLSGWQIQYLYFVTKVIPIYNMQYIKEMESCGTQIHFTWAVIIAPEHSTHIIYDKWYDITHYEVCTLMVITITISRNQIHTNLQSACKWFKIMQKFLFQAFMVTSYTYMFHLFTS